MLYNARISKHYGMGRNIYIYITIWSYKYIITNGHISYDSRIDTNPNSIAYNWTTFPRTSIRLSYNNTFMYVTITTYFSSTIDGYIICMTYINTPRFDCLLLFPTLFYLPIDGTRPYTEALLVEKKLQTLYDEENGKS